MIHESIAIGGPRAGIKLTSGHEWDGRVAKPKQNMNRLTVFYAGHYRWTRDGWKWCPLSIEDNHRHDF